MALSEGVEGNGWGEGADKLDTKCSHWYLRSVLYLVE
jgi:hypothetical protein